MSKNILILPDKKLENSWEIFYGSLSKRLQLYDCFFYRLQSMDTNIVEIPSRVQN